MKVLGWSIGKDKHGDDNGVWHLIIADDFMEGTAQAACSKKKRTSGMVQAKVKGNICGRCDLFAKRLGVER